MFARITLKRVGYKWYVDIPHEDPVDISLDEKANKLLFLLDKYEFGKVDIYFSEQNEIIVEEGLLQISDSDLNRYFTTDDVFLMEIYINKHKFYISSQLYLLLEYYYNFSFHENIYTINVL